MRKTSILVVFGVALIMLSVPFVSAEQVHIQYKLPDNLSSIPSWLNVTANHTISNHKLVFNQFANQSLYNGWEWMGNLFEINNETLKIKHNSLRYFGVWHNFTIILSDPANPIIYYPLSKINNGFADVYYINYIISEPMGKYIIKLESSGIPDAFPIDANTGWQYLIRLSLTYDYTTETNTVGLIYFPKLYYKLPNTEKITLAQYQQLSNETLIKVVIKTYTYYLIYNKKTEMGIYSDYSLTIYNKEKNELIYNGNKASDFVIPIHKIKALFLKTYARLEYGYTMKMPPPPLPSMKNHPHRSLTVNSLTMDITEGNITNNGGNSTSNPVGSKTSNYPLTYNTGLILGILLILIIIATDIYIHRKFP